MSRWQRSGLQNGGRPVRWSVSGTRLAVVVIVVLLIPSVSPAQTAQLLVRSNVAEAAVSIDGQQVGYTNADGEVFLEDVAPGTHTVRLSKPGYWTASTRTMVEADLTTVVSLELAVRRGGVDLLVETNVSAAVVFLDEERWGETGGDGQITLSGVEPGVHRLVVEKDGYESADRRLPVSETVSTQAVQVRLERSAPNGQRSARTEGDTTDGEMSGTSAVADSLTVPDVAKDTSGARMVVYTNVARAEVHVGGTVRGTTKHDGSFEIETDAGQYQVSVEKEGYTSAQETVRLATGETNTLSLTLPRSASTTFSDQDLPLTLIIIVAGVLAIGALVVMVILLWRRSGSTPGRGAGVLERYRLLAMLGTEGITSLYHVEDLVEGRQVVLKVLNQIYENEPEVVQAFLEQGEALQDITASQPGAPIVNAFRYGREKEWKKKRAFIELEYVQGKRLSSYLEEHGPFEVGEALTILRQVCMGLQVAHDHHLWHGGLTPENVIVTHTDPEVRVKLVNFQVDVKDRKRQGGAEQASAFMSPEQRRGEQIDGSTDVYAAGILFYTMVTGTPPSADQDRRAVVEMHETANLPRLPTEIPSRVEALFDRMLNTDPENRPAASNIAEILDLVRETT